MDNAINCWFYDQEVQPADMKLITSTLLQMCFAANGGNPLAMGITPTINGSDISYTKGFVYFGETSNADFIERTGTNQLMAVIGADLTPLVGASCYLYIKPVITYNPNNTVATVTGELYTSTNSNDEGLRIATITNNTITEINSINPLGATQLQKGAIPLYLFDAYGKLSANNSWTGDNAFSKSPTVPTPVKGSNNTQAANMAALFAGLADKANLSGASFTGPVNVQGAATQGQGIIASGSNANGTWIKFADGTIEQRGLFTASSSGFSWVALPIAFTSNISYSVATTVINSTFVGYAAMINTPAASSFGLAVTRTDNNVLAAASVMWVAIGK